MRVQVDAETVRRAFEPLMQSAAFAESAAIVAAGGQPLEMLRAMSLRPELLRALGSMCEAISPGGIVEREVKELIILDVSQRNRCQFCASTHEHEARELGLGDSPLTLLEDLTRLPDRQRYAVEYARAATRDSNRVPESLMQTLHGLYSDAELVEITAVIGFISMLNLFNNCLGVRHEDGGASHGV